MKNNFCHIIGCSVADRCYLSNVWHCLRIKDDTHAARCAYITTDGAIDMENQRLMSIRAEFTQDVRSEIQILSALLKSGEYDKR